MTNLGFHRLMEEHGVRVITTPVGDRYVLEALWREGGVLGGEQSGHLIYLRDHVTGDGLAAALLLCARRSRGTTLAEAAARDADVPAGEGERPRRPPELAERLQPEVERLNEELGGERPRARPAVRARSPSFGSSPRRETEAGGGAALC